MEELLHRLGHVGYMLDCLSEVGENVQLSGAIKGIAEFVDDIWCNMDKALEATKK
jgi:hypothetical protein